MMQRRAFLKLFMATTAAIVVDPKVLIADTTATAPTALVFTPHPVEVVCDATIVPADTYALAQLMAEFARKLCWSTGIPEHRLFGSTGAPTADQYYEHLVEQQRRWHAEATRRAIDIFDARIIKGMEAETYDVHILSS